jgi:hypothetical protein
MASPSSVNDLARNRVAVTAIAGYRCVPRNVSQKSRFQKFCWVPDICGVYRGCLTTSGCSRQFFPRGWPRGRGCGDGRGLDRHSAGPSPAKMPATPGARPGIRDLRGGVPAGSLGAFLRCDGTTYENSSPLRSSDPHPRLPIWQEQRNQIRSASSADLFQRSANGLF